MNAQGMLIVWGSLFSVVLAIVVGAFFKATPWGGALMVLGFLGLLGWICFAIWLANAMNTDI